MRSLLAGSSLALLALLSLTVAPAPAADSGDGDAGGISGRMVLLLDSSGSMAEPAAGGGTKIEAAKQALGQVAERIPEGVEVGARVFGATVEDRSMPGACRDTQSVVPVGPVDQDALQAAVADYRPFGETPIGAGLQAAARDLGPAEDGVRRTIVLLSDGEPTCEPDPCVVASRLRDRGIDLRINVVGLDVAGEARRALQCIAQAGGGRYVDADSAEELNESLVAVSVRGLRDFSVAGTPVTGGRSTAEPTALEPGDYTDRSLPDEAPLFYSVPVPEGGGVSVALAMRPESGDTVDSAQVALLTPDGAQCSNATAVDANVLLLRSIVGASAVYFPSTGSYAGEACAEADELLAQVSFNGPATPFSLKVRGYPEVEGYDTLPGPADPEQARMETVTLEGRGTPVIGGGSFEDAPTLEPGTTYSDTLRPREQLIYKVPVGWGQAPRFTARLESDVRAADLQDIFGIQVQVRGFSALGQALPNSFDADAGIRDSGRYDGTDPVTLTNSQMPVRLRNIESTSSEARANVVAGDYYFTVEMGGDSERADERFAAPVRLAVALDGDVEAEPGFASDVEGEPTEQASGEAEDAGDASQAADRDSGPGDDSALPSWALPLGAGVAGTLLVVGGIAWVRRRRG